MGEQEQPPPPPQQQEEGPVKPPLPPRKVMLRAQEKKEQLEEMLQQQVSKRGELSRRERMGLDFALRQREKVVKRKERRAEEKKKNGGWEERPLGAIEYFFYKLKTMVIWCVVDLEGPVTKAIAEGAVMATVKRHAKLRCRMNSRRHLEAPPFEVFMKEHPIMVIEEPDSDPVEIAEREMARGKLQRCRGLTRLWSIYLTGHGDRRSAVVLANHTLLDGSSLALWLNEISSYGNTMIEAGGSAEVIQSVIDGVEPLPLLDPFETFISWWPERWARIMSPQWFFQRLVIATKRPQVPKSTSSDPNRTTRVLIHWLSKEDTSVILERIKEQGTTVAGAVGAAGLIAVRKLMMEVKDPHVYMQINLTLRVNAIKRGTFDMLEELGETSVPVNQIHRPDHYDSVWSLARKVRNDLRRSIRKGEYFETIKEMAYCKSTSAFTFPVVVKTMKTHHDGRFCGVNFVSMGDIDQVMPPSEGAVQPLRIAAGVDVRDFGGYLTLTCLTLRGCLGLFLTTAEPITTREQSERMRDIIVQELLHSTSPPPPATVKQASRGKKGGSEEEEEVKKASEKVVEGDDARAR